MAKARQNLRKRIKEALPPELEGLQRRKRVEPPEARKARNKSKAVRKARRSG